MEVTKTLRENVYISIEYAIWAYSDMYPQIREKIHMI